MLESQTSRAASSAPAERPVVLNPLDYPAWDSLLATHREAGFFHSYAWARVLHDTYGHEPIYFCTFEERQLQEMVPVMEVSSRWTGRRGVALPFTDFSPPLGRSTKNLDHLYKLAAEHGRERGWRSLECRGNGYGFLKAAPSLEFHGHTLELERGEDQLFKSLEGSMRRSVRKAEAAGVKVEFGDTMSAMQSFFDLHCRTRRRHGVPPQPWNFFENIAKHVLARGHGFVATARLEKRPLASAVFFHYGPQVLYKFGASDFRFQQLRPNNLMMWEAIKKCANQHFAQMHLGRTSLANEGLRRFKLGLGAREEKISYYKYAFKPGAFVTDVDRSEGWVNRVFRFLPLGMLRLAGRALYPHLA
jgi:hypothetical protein